MLGRYLAGVCMILGLLMVAGCGGGRPEADLVFISQSGHNTMDPQRMSWLHDFRVARCLYEPMLRYDFKNGKFIDGVAASWEMSEDGLRYTFTIREDAKWSNGEAVRSDDFYWRGCGCACRTRRRTIRNSFTRSKGFAHFTIGDWNS